ncbi:MAG: transcriptional regulator [Paracoccaceae bacterium]|nr:MAG: transcriptional regulator [Paracoccaceae bacterium]
MERDGTGGTGEGRGGRDTGGGRGGIQVIARAARILRVIRDNPAGMSLGRIAARAGLPRSTVQRIVAALQEEGLVAADPRGGGLRLGPEITALAEAARVSIVETCRLLLTELARATGETADLSVLRGPAMIFLDQVPGTHRLRTVSAVGEAFPLTTTANGRACLACLPVQRATELAEQEWERQGQKGDISRLLDMLETIRNTGLAYDIDEHTDGISAIGFAFRDRSGDLLAISVPVPSSRFADVRSRVENALLNTRKHIAKTLGTETTT